MSNYLKSIATKSVIFAAFGQPDICTLPNDVAHNNTLHI